MPIRFLITFDDGPSIRKNFNPTLAIADQLATNDVQPGIKAIFFVQTLNARGGGTPEGREIMRQISSRGHILGLHSVSPRGHVNHTKIRDDELGRSLREAKDLLRGISGSDPLFVRPPYVAHNLRTRAVYDALHLDLLTTDIRARDGIVHVLNASFRRRLYVRGALAAMRRRLQDLPVGAAPFPLVISFHDVNPYTAKHMTEYLHILVDEARQVGFALPERPFYGMSEDVAAVGAGRCIPPPQENRSAGQDANGRAAMKPARGSGG